MSQFGRAYVVWFDVTGRRSLRAYGWQEGDSSTGQDIVDGVLACSSAGWLDAVSWSVIYPSPPVVPSDSVYVSVTDYATLYFLCDDTVTTTEVVIPAPQQSIFLADNVTVDSSVTSVADLIGQVLLRGQAPNGALPVSFIAGYRRGKRVASS